MYEFHPVLLKEVLQNTTIMNRPLMTRFNSLSFAKIARHRLGDLIHCKYDTSKSIFVFQHLQNEP